LEDSIHSAEGWRERGERETLKAGGHPKSIVMQIERVENMGCEVGWCSRKGEGKKQRGGLNLPEDEN